MAKTLKIALTLSVTIHLALLLLHIEPQPLIEGNLSSLDLRLEISSKSTPNPQSISSPELEEKINPSPVFHEEIAQVKTESPETLIAEETVQPVVPHDQNNELDIQKNHALSDLQEARIEESLHDDIEPNTESATASATFVVTENPEQIITPIQTLKPIPPSILTKVEPKEIQLEQNVLEQIAFTDREQPMLERKVKEWSETFHRIDTAEPTVQWKHRGQQYRSMFTEIPAVDDKNTDELLIEISKEEDGRTFSTELRLKKLVFSSFAQFIDKWDSNVSMHQDEITGRFHSNSEVRIAYDRSGGPIFHGKVTTSFRGINSDSARGRMKRSDMFLGGLETNVRRIALPRDFSLFPTTADENQIHFFEKDTTITFYANGTFGTRPLGSTEPETKINIGDQSAYLIASPKTALHVKGVVNGSVLVYSPVNIIIEDDLIYESSPEVNPETDDYLGLVSNRFIKIADAETTGDGDLIIHASIYAKRRFSVGRFGSGNSGVLVIYGSLAAGSMSATEPRYSTRIDFDPRLENKRAPSFPMTNRYEIIDWDNQWTIENSIDELPEATAKLPMR